MESRNRKEASEREASREESRYIEALVEVKKRLEGESVLRQSAKFLDVLASLALHDRDDLNKSRELTKESSIEVLEVLLPLLCYKDRFDRLVSILNILDKEKLDKLEKLVNK